MPSVVRTETASVGSSRRERPSDPVANGFTAVNGTSSPPDAHRTKSINGMPADTIHVRPQSQNPSPQLDQRAPLPGREEWPAPRSTENGATNGHHSLSPQSDSNRDQTPLSPGKRKRSSSTEHSSSYPSPDDSSLPTKRRFDSYPPGRDDSPQSVSHSRPPMEQAQHRPLPSMDRPDRERAWPREANEHKHSIYPDGQYRDHRTMEASRDPNSSSEPPAHVRVDSQSLSDRQSTTEMTRAGVQVDPKKQRKRQFANRTKTGCGTCRRRKKKCDEAKPECQNCARGGFICEGYAHKVPWPKNGITKSHPPLQAKDRYPVEPAQLYHSHGATAREPYPEPGNSNEGARARPIVVEERDRRNGWGASWDNPPRASYPPEHAAPQSERPLPPTTASHGRPPVSEPHPHHASHSAQRPHNLRIYHHTPQTMSQVVNNSAVTAEAALHHPAAAPPPPPQAQPPSHPQPPQPPATSGPPGPPPAHYGLPPPRPQRTEKDKMLSGEAFLPYQHQLLADREQCKLALFRLNSTTNNYLEITRDERERHVRAVVTARWLQHSRGPDPPVSGTLGTQVYVDTPFHCDYGYNIHIADYVNIGVNCKFLDSGRITIGRNTTISAGVTIDTQKAPSDTKSLKGTRGAAIASDVHIGENVWVGANTTICAGVKIGTGAIIHPGSVVVRDVPRDCVVRGPHAEVRGVFFDD